MSELKDVYKEVPNWREIHKGMNRPEYVLKNGSARNCYGLLKDIHGLQEENQRLTAIATKHATRADELWEALDNLLELIDSCEGLAGINRSQYIIEPNELSAVVEAKEVLDITKIDAVSNSNYD